MALFFLALFQFSAAHLHVALHKMLFVITGESQLSRAQRDAKDKKGSCFPIRIRKNVNKLNVIPFNFGAVLKSLQDSISPPFRPSYLLATPFLARGKLS